MDNKIYLLLNFINKVIKKNKKICKMITLKIN